MSAKEVSSKKQIAAVDWFTWTGKEAHLIGGKCKICGDYFFPKISAVCHNPNCMSKDVEQVLLSNKGKVWSYTVQRYKPPEPYKGPDPFVPFGVVEVEFPEGLKIIGQTTSDCDLKSLKIGMDVQLTVEPLYQDEDGNDVMVWKFKPTGN